MLKKNFKHLGIFIIIIGVFVLIHYIFGTSWMDLGILLTVSIFAGLLTLATQLLVFSYLDPSDWLFSRQAKLQGVMQGIMISIIVVGAQLMDRSPLTAGGVVLAIVISTALGIFFLSRQFEYKNVEPKDAVDFSEYGKPILFEQGKYMRQNEQAVPGLLYLTKHHLIFYSTKTNKILQSSSLSDLHPTLKRSDFLKIPEGIQLAESGPKIDVKFPYYWLKKIKKHF